MAAAITLVDNPMARHPAPGADVVGVTILVDLTANYPANGEPLDLSPYLKNCVGMTFAGWGAIPAGGGTHLIPVPHQAVAAGGTAWLLRMHATGAAPNAAFPEFPAGAYPTMTPMRFICWGRPAADAT